MASQLHTIFIDSFTGVTGTFFAHTGNRITFTGSGTVNGSFDGETSASSKGEFYGTGDAVGSFTGYGKSVTSFSGGGTVGSAMGMTYQSDTHHEIFYPLTDFPCAICCMIPDSFCLEISVCGHIHRARLKKGFDKSQPNIWVDCTGDVDATLVCDQPSGFLGLTAETIEGNGFVFTPKFPQSVCPFYVDWVDGRDPDMPGVRCGPGPATPVAYCKLYVGSDCGDCAGGNGVTVKGVSSEHNDCCAVCTCCAFQPGRDKLYARIDAFGCDFNKAVAVLEAKVNDCTWTYTIPAGTTYPNCPDITIQAKCVDGYWQTKVITDALLDCDPEPFHVIHAECDPFRVEAISQCMAAT
jgi:hypothetical protein